VDPRTGLDEVEKEKNIAPAWTRIPTTRPSSRSLSLYPLRYTYKQKLWKFVLLGRISLKKVDG
jgi:hypothetical protein